MDKESVHATALDKAISTNHIQILKTAIPYVTVDKQKYFSIFVKYLELMNTISYFQSDKAQVGIYSADMEHPDMFGFINEIREYLTKKDQEMIDSFINMFQMMKMFEAYKDMFDMEGDGDSSANPFDMVKGMLSPEQQAMFNMYENMM